MDAILEEKLRRLTPNQANALSAVISGSISSGTASGSFISNATGLTGRALGGTVSALERNDLIQPLGQQDRQLNWELSDLALKRSLEEQPDWVNDILKRISQKK